MKTENNVNTASIHPAPLGKRMLQGAGIALVLISLFLYGVNNPDPAWPKFWMLKPLLIVPIAGALGGVFYYYMDHLFYQGGWIKLLAHVMRLVGYVIALWLGTVLGLNGTLWN